MLYAVGLFNAASGRRVNRIARWNGWHWEAIGEGLGGAINAAQVFNDGSGELLFVGGSFINRLARWDGETLSVVPGLGSTVHDLSVFDDGGGESLYIGGEFTSATGAGTVNRIVRYNAQGFSAVGAGFDDTVRVLKVLDDGSGPALYAGGSFTTADGEEAKGIARWDGQQWHPIGDGLDGSVRAIAMHDDGNGLALYAGGDFAGHVARWDGEEWSTVGDGVDNFVNDFAVYDDGSGPALYITGGFQQSGSAPARRLARWDGADWLEVGGGLGGAGDHLDVIERVPGNPVLLVAGGFVEAGDVRPQRMAVWDGTSWDSFGTGLDPAQVSVRATSVFDDGSGPAVFAGGGFIGAGGLPLRAIARWDASGWARVGDGTGFNSTAEIDSMTVFDDGDGPALYVGGSFSSIDGVPARNLARWDGQSWSEVAGGVNCRVNGLFVYQEPGAPRPSLYVGGCFTFVGESNLSANRVARWDGDTWSNLGSGVSGGGGPRVYAFEVFDDGTGPALIVAGNFNNAGGGTVNNIAKWRTGEGWSALGVGTDNTVRAILSDHADPLSGEASLYAVGAFSNAGGQPASRIARWRSGNWSAMSEGFTAGSLRALSVFGEGAARALYVGGNITQIDGVPVSAVARWDGQNWSAAGAGLQGPEPVFSSTNVDAMTTIDEGFGLGPSLLVMGGFSSSVSGDSHAALWSACPEEVLDVIFADGFVQD
ncbi:MAG: hypothetical protein ACXIUM_11305 [Wenzhouxiangella sp.]